MFQRLRSRYVFVHYGEPQEQSIVVLIVIVIDLVWIGRGKFAYTGII